jgi:hypothetical protein
MSNYTLGDSYGIGNIMSSIYQKAVPIISPGGKLTTHSLSDHQAEIVRPTQGQKRKAPITPTPSLKRRETISSKKHSVKKHRNTALQRKKSSKPHQKTQKIPNIF